MGTPPHAYSLHSSSHTDVAVPLSKHRLRFTFPCSITQGAELLNSIWFIFLGSSLQLKAKFEWLIKNWLFEEFEDFFKRKLTLRLSPFRLTSLSIIPYGSEMILLTGTVPKVPFFPVKSLVSLLQETVRGDHFFERHLCFSYQISFLPIKDDAKFCDSVPVLTEGQEYAGTKWRAASWVMQ